MTFKFAGEDGKDLIIPFGSDPIEAKMRYIVGVDEPGGLLFHPKFRSKIETDYLRCTS